MIGLGSAIGGGLKAVGGIFGGMAASKAMKKVKRNLQKQLRENQDWFDQRYNEDATQRADAQAAMTQMREDMRNRTRQAAGAQAVMGGTDESVAAEKAANSNAMAQAASAIAVNGANRKDAIEQQYLGNKADLNQQLNNMEVQRGQAISNAVKGVAETGADIAGIL